MLAWDFTDKAIVPEVVEVVVLVGLKSERSGIGLVAGKWHGNGGRLVGEVAGNKLVPLAVDGEAVNVRVGAAGEKHINRAEGLALIVEGIKAGEVVLHFRSHAAEGCAKFDTAGDESDEGEHGTTMKGSVRFLGLGVFERFTIRVVTEDGAVLEPTQADTGSHLGFEVRGVTPDTLQVGEAGGDVESWCAVFTEITFVKVGTLAETFAGEIENLTISGSGGEGFVLEATVRAPGGFRVVELDAFHALAGKALPGGEGVFLKAGIRIIKFHEGHVVRVFGVEAGDVVVEHPVGVGHGEILARHVALEISEGNAAEAGDFFAKFVESFVGRSEGVILGPVMVVPPALLGVTVVGVAIIVGLETNRDGRVIENAGFLGDRHLFDEAFGIVDRFSFAVFAGGDHPTAESWEVILVEVDLVRIAHRSAVTFEGDEGIG